MRDWEYVDFFILVGDTDVTVDAKATESENADGSSDTDITDAAITQIGATSDNRMVVISVKKSTTTKRYVGIQVTVGNSTGANVAILAAQYNHTGRLPVTQTAAGANSYLTAQVVKV
jgi:hypothetical protein